MNTLPWSTTTKDSGVSSSSAATSPPWSDVLSSSLSIEDQRPHQSWSNRTNQIPPRAESEGVTVAYGRHMYDLTKNFLTGLGPVPSANGPVEQPAWEYPAYKESKSNRDAVLDPDDRDYHLETTTYTADELLDTSDVSHISTSTEDGNSADRMSKKSSVMWDVSVDSGSSAKSEESQIYWDRVRANEKANTQACFREERARNRKALKLRRDASASPAVSAADPNTGEYRSNCSVNQVYTPNDSGEPRP